MSAAAAGWLAAPLLRRLLPRVACCRTLPLVVARTTSAEPLSLSLSLSFHFISFLHIWHCERYKCNNQLLNT
jgi:hypothetical protein